MSKISGQSKQITNRKYLYVFLGITLVAASLFAYLMWYVAPVENIEMVKIVAVTENGCIGETFDGFAVNIGECQSEPGEIISVAVDQKEKERAALMNPTR